MMVLWSKTLQIRKRVRVQAFCATNYTASEISETIVVFTDDGIDNLRHVVDERRAASDVPPKPAAD